MKAALRMGLVAAGLLVIWQAIVSVTGAQPFILPGRRPWRRRWPVIRGFSCPMPAQRWRKSCSASSSARRSARFRRW